MKLPTKNIFDIRKDEKCFVDAVLTFRRNKCLILGTTSTFQRYSFVPLNLPHRAALFKYLKANIQVDDFLTEKNENGSNLKTLTQFESLYFSLGFIFSISCLMNIQKDSISRLFGRKGTLINGTLIGNVLEKNFVPCPIINKKKYYAKILYLFQKILKIGVSLNWSRKFELGRKNDMMSTFQIRECEYFQISFKIVYISHVLSAVKIFRRRRRFLLAVPL